VLRNPSAPPAPVPQTIYNVKYFCQRPHQLQRVASNNPAKKYCTDKVYKYIYIYIYLL